MTYRARYVSRSGEPDYWRTVQAESITSAMRRAERYARTGYLLATVLALPSDNLLN